MLIRARFLQRFTLRAMDGDIGKVHDFYFDDRQWAIRYLVADTRRWLPGRQVLISPVSLDRPILDRRELPVLLTSEQIRHSPGVESDRPVSRQMEGELSAYYGWPMYWSGGAISVGGMGEPMAGMGGPGLLTPRAGAASATQSASATATAEMEGADLHLRSVRDVLGYHIQCTDGELGHIDDFLLEDRHWLVRYVVAELRNWLPGGRTLLPPASVSRFVWEEALAHVDLPQELLRTAPAFDRDTPVTSDYETALQTHYRRGQGSDED